MNEQIKVDELPDGLFVSDIPYLSGNKDFVNKQGIYNKQCGKCEMCILNIESGWDYDCGDIIFIPSKIFGTKHIQLVAANCKLVSYDDTGTHMFNNGQTMRGTNPFTRISKKEMKKAIELRNQGKDYFIYEVREEVNNG